jgi:calcineurin-like phosphoesterase family protein
MNETKIFFTSDTHFGHVKEFLWGPRGFNSIEEHDEVIIKNWNEVVGPNDEVWHLGDVMLNDNEHGLECLKRLNGKIHLILGNHDTETRIELYKTCPNIVSIDYAKEIKIGKNYFWLCHYPTCVGNFDDNKKIWCLCGHSHTQDRYADMDKKSYHVELDAHQNYPIEIKDIIKDIYDYKSKWTKMTT